jgi:hypothetical protein
MPGSARSKRNRARRFSIGLPRTVYSARGFVGHG